MSKITIKNISTATVVIATDTFRRSLQPGREVPITYALYEDLMFDPGFNNMLKGHYIVVKGVNEDQQVVKDESTVYDVQAIEAFFDDKNYVDFAKFIAGAAPAEKETTIQLAIDKGITDSGFVSLIQKYCNIDVISAINQKHQTET